MNEPTVVILAAGKGARLGNHTKENPKSLTPVNGKPIIEYAISWVRMLAPKKIVVVGGYLFGKLKDSVKTIDPQVLLVENKLFDTTQRMASLLCAENKISDGMLQFDGDFIFHHALAETVKPHLKGNMKIFCTTQKYATLDMSVSINKEGCLVDMFKGGTDTGLYYTSLFYCPGKMVKPFFAFAREEIAKKGAGMNLEDVLVAYARGGGAVEVVPVAAPEWIEVDTAEDLAHAEEIIQKDPTGFILVKVVKVGP